jgi:hypothetical protein
MAVCASGKLLYCQDILESGAGRQREGVFLEFDGKLHLM